MSGERGEFSPNLSAPEGVAEQVAPVLKGAEIQQPITFSPAEARKIREDALKASINRTRQ